MILTTTQTLVEKYIRVLSTDTAWQLTATVLQLLNTYLIGLLEPFYFKTTNVNNLARCFLISSHIQEKSCGICLLIFHLESYDALKLSY